MPPKPKLNPIRQLRDALSRFRGKPVTQAQFADELGISRSLVNALETKASRPISDGLRRLLAERYGIALGKEGPYPIAARTSPLLEGLRKHAEQQAILDAAALGALEAEEIPRLRAILLAAHRAGPGSGKAAQLYFRLHQFAVHLLRDLALPDAYELAKRELDLNQGALPPNLARTDIPAQTLLLLRMSQVAFPDHAWSGEVSEQVGKQAGAPRK